MRPAAPERPARKPKPPSPIQRARNYFRPGRDVPSHGGTTTRVVGFNAADEYSWTVTVDVLDTDGNPTGEQRRHRTMPDERAMKASEAENPVGSMQEGEGAPETGPFGPILRSY